MHLDLNDLLGLNIPEDNNISDMLTDLEWDRIKHNLPDWTNETEAREQLEKRVAMETPKLLRILRQIQPDVIEHRALIANVANPNASNNYLPKIPRDLYSIEGLSETGMRIILSFLTGLPINKILRIGPSNRKTVFILNYPDSKSLVARFWNINFGQFQNIFGEPESISSTLRGKSEPLIHSYLTTSFAPRSTQLPTLPVDICERLIALSDLYQFLDLDLHAEFWNKVQNAKKSNPFAQVRDTDCGIGIREINGEQFLYVLSFDWSDPQYFKHQTIESIQEELSRNPTPLMIPIQEVPQEILEVL